MLSPVMLKERAFEEIKRLIQSGEFAPQSTLSERQLATRLGMSKTPIRAALENLASQGLVTVSPQRGIFVRELTAREIAELFDVRMAVEPVISAQLAGSSLSSSQREAMKSNLRQQALAAEAEDFLAATELDIAFHRLLARLLDNREMMVWLERCFDQIAPLHSAGQSIGAGPFAQRATKITRRSAKRSWMGATMRPRDS